MSLHMRVCLVTVATGLPATGSHPHTLHRDSERETRLTGLTTQEVHLAAVIEILQSIRQSDMSPILSRIYGAPGGTEALDVLMKYMYVVAPIDDRTQVTALGNRPSSTPRDCTTSHCTQLTVRDT
jgi:hypothetical protein